MPNEKKNLIRWIYLYLFTAIGLAMLLIGSYQLIQHVTKKVFLPKYYLEFNEQRCDYLPPVVPPLERAQVGTAAALPDQMAQPSKEECLNKLEEQRKYEEVIRLSGSLTLIILGSATFLFHYKKTQIS